MQVTFNTNNQDEIVEVMALLSNMGILSVTTDETKVESVPERKAKTPTKPKVSETIPEVTPTVETTPTPSKEAKITLADLKDLAKSKVDSTSREEVKAVISKYGDKLTEVKTSDYLPLSNDLKAL